MNTTAAPFDVTFNLTVTVTGRSLQDIDDGLVAAAGERLRARMVNPPRLNGADVMSRAPTPPSNTVTVLREEPRPNSIAPAASPASPIASGETIVAPMGNDDAPAKNKRGVKPGSTRGSYKKPEGEEAAGEVAAAQPATTQPAPVASTPPQTVAVAPQVQTPAATQADGAIPTLEQCVAALTKVNKEKNTDVAYKCLTDLGFKRCGEIPDARRAEFIARCELVAAGS